MANLHITTTAIRALYDTETHELLSRNIIAQHHQDSVLWLNGHSGAISRQYYLKKKQVNAVKDGRYVMGLILNEGVDDEVALDEGSDDSDKYRADDFADDDFERVDDVDDAYADADADDNNKCVSSFECEQDDNSTVSSIDSCQDHNSYDNRENFNMPKEYSYCSHDDVLRRTDSKDIKKGKNTGNLTRQSLSDAFPEEINPKCSVGRLGNNQDIDDNQENYDINRPSAPSLKERVDYYFDNNDTKESRTLRRSDSDGSRRSYDNLRGGNHDNNRPSDRSFAFAKEIDAKEIDGRRRYDNLRGKNYDNNRPSGRSSKERVDYCHDNLFRQTDHNNDRRRMSDRYYEKMDAEEIEVLTPLPLRLHGSAPVSSTKEAYIKEAYVNWTNAEIEYTKNAYKIIYAQLPPDQKRFISKEILDHIRNDPEARKIFHPSHLECSGKFRHVIRTYIEK